MALAEGAAADILTREAHRETLALVAAGSGGQAAATAARSPSTSGVVSRKTHDLLSDVLDQIDAKCEKVSVTELQEQIEELEDFVQSSDVVAMQKL